MDYRNLKRGDVIVFDRYGHRVAIFDRIENNCLYTYVDYVDNEDIFFEKYEPLCGYLLHDITIRLANGEEKLNLYNAIGKYFTEEYDKDWYNHFTDSSYFDVQDFLLDMFCIKVEEYDNDMIYPDFIDDIHTYIWEKLCKSMGYKNYGGDEFVEQLVNKQEFIAKAVKYLEANFPDIENVGGLYKESFINNFCKTMEE